LLLVVESLQNRCRCPAADDRRLWLAWVLLDLAISLSHAVVQRTRTGRTIIEEKIDALATEVAGTDYDVEARKTRRRSRPSMGSGPADVVPVRIDPELQAAIEARAQADRTTTSEIIREAIPDSSRSPVRSNPFPIARPSRVRWRPHQSARVAT
jgi:hypothetical protein